MTPLDYDIIMLALPRWDGPYSSTAYSLAKALSVHTRVFYIDNPFTYKDYFSGKNSDQIQRRKTALRQGQNIFTTPDTQYPRLTAVTPRLTWPINWLPPGALYDRMAEFNDRILQEAIRQTIDANGIKRYVFINSFNPLYGRYFSADFKPEFNVYHSVDDISKSVYISRHGTRLEGEAVSKADFTVVTSSELKRLKSAQGEHVYFLPNAADTTLFQQASKGTLARPPELQSVPPAKKIICYTGNICHRLDYELLVKIATRHPDKLLLMVGPLSNDNYKKAGLDKLQNVLFTGRKKIEELPGYLQHSHCCIIPFAIIPLTRSIYPLKINEYLSAGKPVITTNFSEDIATFENVAFVSNSHEEFVESIDKAIDSDNDVLVQERVRYSSQNNWAARAEQFVTIIGEHKKMYGAGRDR